MSEKLKPCPFCGDDMSSFAGMIEGAFGTCNGGYLICCDCGATGQSSVSMCGAIHKWNTRIKESDTEITKLKGLLLRGVKSMESGHYNHVIANEMTKAAKEVE